MVARKRISKIGIVHQPGNQLARFNRRVLFEALDNAIRYWNGSSSWLSSSNLDEFFMKRVGPEAAIQRRVTRRTIDGLTPTSNSPSSASA